MRALTFVLVCITCVVPGAMLRAAESVEVAEKNYAEALQRAEAEFDQKEKAAREHLVELLRAESLERFRKGELDAATKMRERAERLAMRKHDWTELQADADKTAVKGSAAAPTSSEAQAAPGAAAAQPGAPSIVRELKKSELQGLRMFSPDGKSYLINKDDENGIFQVYIGKTGSTNLTCITNTQQPNSPKPERMKMQAQWHPSGKWIFMAVERDEYTTPPILGSDPKFVKGQLQCGIWTNMYAVSPDGTRWHRLTDFKSGIPGKADGYTGPAFTRDGRRAVWSQIMDGNVFAYWPFGRWELVLADVEEHDGAPRMTNLKNITPKGMNWNEPGNFHPDGVNLLLTGSVEKDAQGMDQYLLNINTGALTNLTNSPTVWDEHGLFSPDGEKIMFMSAYPYRADPNTSKILTIRTEFMLMNKDGSGLTQLTHFFDPSYPEYSKDHGIAACPDWNPDGHSALLSRLVYPNYEYWEIALQDAKSPKK
jgi:Tol biopolymer transport system component